MAKPWKPKPGDRVRALEDRYNSLGYWIERGHVYEVAYAAPEREIIGLKDQGYVEWWMGRFRPTTRPLTVGTEK